MDTKLRNFNSLKLKKTIAVILAAVLFFTSGLFICFLVKGGFYYNRYESKGTYTSSNVFYNTFSRFERTALANGELISCENKEDYLKTDAGKAAERAMRSRAEQVRKACDYLDSLGIKVYVLKDNLYRYSWTDYDGGTHYFSYDGNEESRDDLEYEFSYYDYGEFPDDEDVSSPDIPETTAFDNSADTAASRYEPERQSAAIIE